MEAQKIKGESIMFGFSSEAVMEKDAVAGECAEIRGGGHKRLGWRVSRTQL